MLQPPRRSHVGPEPSCLCSWIASHFPTSHFLLLLVTIWNVEYNLLWARTELHCVFCQADVFAHGYSKSMQQLLHFRCTVMGLILHRYNFHWLYELRRLLDSLLVFKVSLYNNDSNFPFIKGSDGEWLCNPKVPAFGETLACSWSLVLFPTCQHGAVFLLQKRSKCLTWQLYATTCFHGLFCAKWALGQLSNGL